MPMASEQQNLVKGQKNRRIQLVTFQKKATANDFTSFWFTNR